MLCVCGGVCFVYTKAPLHNEQYTNNNLRWIWRVMRFSERSNLIVFVLNKFIMIFSLFSSAKYMDIYGIHAVHHATLLNKQIMIKQFAVFFFHSKFINPVLLTRLCFSLIIWWRILAYEKLAWFRNKLHSTTNDIQHEIIPKFLKPEWFHQEHIRSAAAHSHLRFSISSENTKFVEWCGNPSICR